MTRLIDKVRTTMEEGLSPAPVGDLVGFRSLALGEGTVTIQITVDERHWNPMGTLHGGILCDVADAAMGLAFATTLDDKESFATLELKINFLRPVWKAKLTAVGRVVKRGDSVGMTECDVTDEEGHLVARASSTCMVLRGNKAKGR